MESEIELRILEIDVDDMKKKLEEIGATKVSDKFLRRYVYYLPGSRNNRNFVRLRTDGNKTTLAVKEVKEKDSIDRVKELEVDVKEFEKTHEVLERLGCNLKGYQETKRISYKLDGVQIEIDIWPKIPPVLEIEGNSKDDVYRIVKLLGYDNKDTTTLHWQEIYSKYGLEIFNPKELKFE